MHIPLDLGGNPLIGGIPLIGPTGVMPIGIRMGPLMGPLRMGMGPLMGLLMGPLIPRMGMGPLEERSGRGPFGKPSFSRSGRSLGIGIGAEIKMEEKLTLYYQE